MADQSKEQNINKIAQQKGLVRAVAETMVKLPPKVDPPILGSRMLIWKQDPSVKGIDLPRTVYVHTQVDDGPRDSQIAIQGVPTVTPTPDRDFLINPANEEAFDAVHTYTIIRQVLTMYQRVLKTKLNWQWNNNGNEDPIAVYPHAGETANAYYSREEKALKFFFFTPDKPTGASKVFTCRSLDIVAHETGHAVLDSLKPGWLSWDAPAETGALHEAFGDLTSIFLVLSQLDQVEYIIAQTKADLHQKNILSGLAEEFGLAIGRPQGLRNADNDLKLSEVTSEVHDLSQVFTGAIFDILADLFTANRDPRVRDSGEVLYQVGKYVAELTLRALIKSPDADATFKDVAEAMIQIAEADLAEGKGYENCAQFVRKHFEFREVLGANTFTGLKDLSSLGLYADRRGCCGTMQHPQYKPKLPS